MTVVAEVDPGGSIRDPPAESYRSEPGTGVGAHAQVGPFTTMTWTARARAGRVGAPKTQKPR